MIATALAAPLKLYERWERQHWSVLDYELGADLAGWTALRPFTRRELRTGMVQYFLGEAAVANTLAPLLQGAPTREEELFLATQIADEARHTLFFLRYLQAVDGEDEPFDAYTAGLEAHWAGGHVDLFERRLEAATDRVRLHPADHGAWYSAVTLYHLLVEAVLAINGERVLLDVVRRLGTLPVLEDGLRKVARDESRHISFGVGALKRGVETGYGATIVTVVRDSLPSVLNVLVDPTRRFPAIIPRDVLEGRIRQLTDFWEAARRGLLKRLRYIGHADLLADIDARWDDALEAALDEYQQRHRRPHPARLLASLPARPL